ncbi:MAG: ester cyclase [Paracoccaceae bacterium]
MDKLEVAKTWYRRVYAEEDLSAIDDMLEPRTDAKGLGGQPLLGPEDFKGFVQGMLALLSDIDISIDKSMEEGDWLASVITISARCRNTGKPITVPGQVMAKVEDGKITEAHNAVDFLSMFSQLGLLPEDAFATCFSGTRVGGT